MRVHSHAHGLAALGHEIYVISQGADEESREWDDGPVHLIRIPGFDKFMPIATEPVRWLTYSAQVAAAVTALDAEKSLDLVVFPGQGGEGFIHLLNQTEWNRIPSIIQIYTSDESPGRSSGEPEADSEFRRIAAMMEETCLRLAAATCSSTEIQQIERFYRSFISKTPQKR